MKRVHQYQPGDRVRFRLHSNRNPKRHIRPGLIGTIRFREGSTLLIEWDGDKAGDLYYALKAYEVEPYLDGLDIMLGVL